MANRSLFEKELLLSELIKAGRHGLRDEVDKHTKGAGQAMADERNKLRGRLKWGLVLGQMHDQPLFSYSYNS